MLRNCHQEAGRLDVSQIIFNAAYDSLNALDSLKYVKSAKAATDVPTTVSSEQSIRSAY